MPFNDNNISGCGQHPQPALICVCLNPALDRYVEIPEFAYGGTNRVLRTRTCAGGKGFNVARMASRLVPAFAVGFLPRNDAALFIDAFERESASLVPVLTEGSARVNTKALDLKTQTITEFNERGQAIPESAWNELEALIAAHALNGNIVAFSGSPPPGCDADIYERLMRRALCDTALDCSGEAFRRGLSARPLLVKPNKDELMELCGKELNSIEAVLDGANTCVSMGASICCVSMGAEGALITDGKKAYHATPPRLNVRSTVGAGDALLAGLCAAYLRDASCALDEALLLGVACASAAVTSEGTLFSAPIPTDRIKITAL